MAIRLAKKINGIIINADSMQVYSNLAILTARPKKEDLQIKEHKLYGYVDGAERYNVAKWCNDVIKIINENIKKKIPLIIVGGTGMYINSLLHGIIDIPSIPESLKKDSAILLEKIGIKNFIIMIKEFDHQSLNNISINDTSRIRRIWEVYKSTGFTFSELKKKENKKYINDMKFNIYLINPPREEIYNKVNLRFHKMIKEGAIDEVQNLNKLNLDKSLPIMRAHGVPEISNYLNNSCNINECIDRGQQVTRNYVKRQLTWWRSSTLPIHQVFNQFPNEIDENLIKI